MVFLSHCAAMISRKWQCATQIKVGSIKVATEMFLLSQTSPGFASGSMNINNSHTSLHSVHSSSRKSSFAI